MKFFKSVVQTMKDTTWLNAKETRRDTTTVVAMSIAFAVFFGVVDYAVQAVLSLIAWFKGLVKPVFFCYNHLVGELRFFGVFLFCSKTQISKENKNG